VGDAEAGVERWLSPVWEIVESPKMAEPGAASLERYGRLVMSFAVFGMCCDSRRCDKAMLEVVGWLLMKYYARYGAEWGG